MKPFLFIMCIVLLNSCKNQASKPLIGKWELDSSSGPNGKLFPAYLYLHMELKNEGIFYYEWMEGDVGNKFQGNFYIKKSKGGTEVLELVPDNSERVIEHLRFKILETNKNRLETSREESYEVGDSTIIFNRVDIFKRK